MLLNNH